MLWEYEPQASVSTAFLSSHSFTKNVFFLFLLENSAAKKKENNLLTLIKKKKLLYSLIHFQSLLLDSLLSDSSISQWHLKL